ncbi:MAG: hypothetical protein L0Y73_04090 [Candidatus Aminicenantes bacterium]|nr:hypothetical protein [Candidatus Aminicenantes bacterium]
MKFEEISFDRIENMLAVVGGDELDGACEDGCHNGGSCGNGCTNGGACGNGCTDGGACGTGCTAEAQ